VTRLALAVALGGAVGWILSTAGTGTWTEAAAADRPEILDVAVLGRPAVGRRGEARVTYRARGANVVAVIQVVEDLDGPRRASRQRELSVVAAAFGREAGVLTVPFAFETPGRKRVVLTLLTDEREESESASVEIEVLP
jgi:hypothetical protein